MEVLQRHFDIALETSDGIKKLRDLILTLAMQGKLVPQAPTDQTASELLKEIKAEKQRLIKEGKIRKQESLPPIKPDEIPYAVPKGWEWVRLGECFVLKSGVSFSKESELTQGKYLYLKVGEMNNAGNELSIMSASIYLAETRTVVNALIPANSIIFPKRGGAIATNKKRIVTFPICVDTNIMAITCPSEIHLMYAYDWLLSHDLALLNTGTSVPQINNKDIAPLLFPLPPLAEQKRIVAKIDQLMALCDKMESELDERNQKRLTVNASAIDRLLTAPDKATFDTSCRFVEKHFSELYSVTENVAELKKAILQLAVMGKLVPQDPADQPAIELLKEIETEKQRLIKEGKIRKQESLPPVKPEEIPYEAPKGWEWVRLGEIADYNGRANADPDEISPDTWVLDLEDIEKDTSVIIKCALYSDRQSKSTKSTFCKGDVLYGKLRPYLNKVVVADKDGVCTTEIVPIVPFRGLDPIFLKVLLKRPTFVEHVTALSYGVKMPRLGTADAVKSLHPLPPLAEQKRIVAKIDQLMALCDALGSKITASTDKQAAILNAVLAKV